MKHQQVTVTNDDWSVSYTTGTNFKGAVLHVSRFSASVHKPRKGEGDGMMFPNTEAANKFAFEHGYLQIYYRRVWCPIHRKLHTFLNKASPFTGNCHE